MPVSGYDAVFLSTLGGDTIDFEMEQGKGSALRTESRDASAFRIDWTQDHDNNLSPAGYDPVNALMDALQHNGDATRDLLTGSVTYTSDGPAGGHLPRLEYLLTDRNWDPTADVPGGRSWGEEVSLHGDAYKSQALDHFGTALERATTDEVGQEGGRLFGAMIYTLNVDEQAAGYDNGETSRPDSKLRDFANADLINPQLRDSMAKITAEYMVAVNENMYGPQAGLNVTMVADPDHLTRFLADLGKDEAAHRMVTDAETVATAARYSEILSGSLDPSRSFDQNVAALAGTASVYGGVVGALDFGARGEMIATSAEKNDMDNRAVEQRFKLAGPLVEGAIDAMPLKYGLGGVATGVAGNVLEGMEEARKGNHQAEAVYEFAAKLGAGEKAASALIEAAIYNSGKLENVPEPLLQDGRLKPMGEWDLDDHTVWQAYKNTLGFATVAEHARAAGDSYKLAVTAAGTTLKS